MTDARGIVDAICSRLYAGSRQDVTDGAYAIALADRIGLAVPQLSVRQHPGHQFQVLYGLRVAGSDDRIISIISLSLCRPDPVTSSTTPSQYASSGVSR